MDSPVSTFTVPVLENIWFLLLYPSGREVNDSTGRLCHSKRDISTNVLKLSIEIKNIMELAS
jgi:hypothetical protein